MFVEKCTIHIGFIAIPTGESSRAGFRLIFLLDGRRRDVVLVCRCPASFNILDVIRSVGDVPPVGRHPAVRCTRLWRG